MQETDAIAHLTDGVASTANPQKRPITYDLVIILMTLIWGGTFLVTKETLKLIGPFTYLGLCYAVGTLALVVIFHQRLRRITRAELLNGCLIGLVLFAAYAFQTTGLQWTTVSKAGFITGLYVPLVPLFSLLLLRQRIPGVAIIGVILSILGLCFLSINRDFNLVLGQGEWLLLCCAVLFALQIVLVGKFAPNADAINLAIIELGLTSILSLLTVPIIHEPIALPPLVSWIPIILLGTCDMAFTLLAMIWVQQFISSTRATLIYALEPMWAALFGHFLAGDVLSLISWIGCLCIFTGMIAGRLEHFSLRRLPRSTITRPDADS